MRSASSQPMERWKATAASPQSPPARMVTASNRWRSLAMRWVNQASVREKKLRNQFVSLNVERTSANVDSIFKYRSSDRGSKFARASQKLDAETGTAESLP